MFFLNSYLLSFSFYWEEVNKFLTWDWGFIVEKLLDVLMLGLNMLLDYLKGFTLFYGPTLIFIDF